MLLCLEQEGEGEEEEEETARSRRSRKRLSRLHLVRWRHFYSSAHLLLSSPILEMFTVSALLTSLPLSLFRVPLHR